MQTLQQRNRELISFNCTRLEHIRKQFDGILKFDETILCDEDRFEIVCCETHILKLNQLIRQFYDERKLILYN